MNAQSLSFEETKKSAELGNANAQYKLGLMYYNGEGTLTDPKMAFYWYKKSAEQGNANAQYYLGLMYYHGVLNEKRKSEEKDEYEEAKQQYVDLFGDGKGQTDEAGNQENPQGDSDSNILEGVSTGTGTVGGGLGNRGVVARPTIRDNSQDHGTVVVKVCVNANGQVLSAEYTQKGSYSISDNLRKKSVEKAKKFKFTPSNISKQCGTITFDYRVQGGTFPDKQKAAYWIRKSYENGHELAKDTWENLELWKY
jgi:TPR repeat protein